MPDKPDMKVYMPKKADMVDFDEHLSTVVSEVVSRIQKQTTPPWWQPSVSQVITVLVVICGWGMVLGRTDSRVTNVETAIKDLSDLTKSLVLKGDEFRHGNDVDHATLVQHESRLIRLEDVNEKLAVIQTKLEQNTHDIVEMKAQMNSLTTSFTGFQIDFNSRHKEK